MIRKCIAASLIFSLLTLIILPDFAFAFLQTDKKPKVAIFPFTNTNKEAKDADYGQAISGMLTTEIINGREFQVVERAQMDKIMSELSFQISGAVDVETARRIGQVFGVDILVFGSVAKFGYLIETDMRLVDTESGQALAAENANSRNESEIRPMVINLARKIEQRYRERFLVNVELSSNPAGANAFVDNSLVGKTPVVARLAPGPHKVRLEMNGYQPWERDFVVQDGVSKLAADLFPIPTLTKETPKPAPAPTQSAPKPVTPAQSETKSGGISPLLLIGGAVVVGGVAAALLLGGKKSETKNGSITVTITDIP